MKDNTKSFQNQKTGTLTTCFGPSTPAAEPTAAGIEVKAKEVALAPAGPTVDLQPAGDPNPSTPAPYRVGPVLPTLQQQYSPDPVYNALMAAVVKAGGDPTAFKAALEATPGLEYEDDEDLEQPGTDVNQQQFPEAKPDAESAEIKPEDAEAFAAARAAEREALKQEQAQDDTNQAPPPPPATPTPDEVEDAAQEQAANEFADLIALVGAGPAKALKAGGLASVAAAKSAPDAQLKAIRGVADTTIEKLRA